MRITYPIQMTRQGGGFGSPSVLDRSNPREGTLNRWHVSPCECPSQPTGAGLASLDKTKRGATQTLSRSPINGPY
jgi:hypothetical protein